MIFKNAIWGSGGSAKRFASVFKGEISFFIDSDWSKCDKLLRGKKVLHPSQIKNWNELYVYIPYNYYDEIVKLLQEYGIMENQYEKYFHYAPIEAEAAINEIENNINDILKLASNNKYNTLCIIDYQISHSLLDEMKKMDKIIFALGNISKEEYFSLEENKAYSYCLPSILKIWTYIKSAKRDKMIKKNLMERDGWSSIREQIQNIFGCDRINAEFQVYCYYYYWERVLDILHPSNLLLEPTVWPQMQILELICKKRKIPYVSKHPGVLPGTYNFDVFGEVGKSLPSVKHEQFRALYISKNDLKLAKDVCELQYKNRLNRKIQPKNDIKTILEKRINKDRPTIFFAAQNDGMSHMVPYSEETQTYYSPIFKFSIDAGIYLGKLCEQNNWNYIYKPHPMYIKGDEVERLPKNTIWVEFGDINDIIDISDVVVTILSTINYDALVRYKPVVMLGYNWSHGQGCTYEAFEEELIEDSIKQAIEYGFTEGMQQAFWENIARMLKYYLYDDMTDRELRYGKPIPESFDGFFTLQRLLENKE